MEERAREIDYVQHAECVFKVRVGVEMDGKRSVEKERGMSIKSVVVTSRNIKQ